MIVEQETFWEFVKKTNKALDHMTRNLQTLEENMQDLQDRVKSLELKEDDI
jgi:tRNA(Phe) wybutosine-synthesizing methylase Tyw3